MTPDHAILVFALGVLLIYLEFNRPGWIMPGAAGVLAVLLSIAALIRLRLNPVAAVLCLTAASLFLTGLRRIQPLSVVLAATSALTLGFIYLNPDIHLIVGLPCGLILGLGTSYLTRIARRARTNKGLD